MAQTPWSLYMVGKEFTSTKLETDVMRLTINFGGPLCHQGKCYKNPETDDEVGQDKPGSRCAQRIYLFRM
eukprot:COSAG05_NODE_788_length_7333_cov_14.016727_4_plen_70_part_00